MATRQHQNNRFQTLSAAAADTREALRTIQSEEASSYSTKISDAERQALSAISERDWLQTEAAKARATQQQIVPNFIDIVSGATAAMRIGFLGDDSKVAFSDASVPTAANVVPVADSLIQMLDGKGNAADVFRQLLVTARDRGQKSMESASALLSRYNDAQAQMTAALGVLDGTIKLARAFIHATQPANTAALHHIKRKKKNRPAPAPAPVAAPTAEKKAA